MATTQPCVSPSYWDEFSQQKAKLCIYQGLEILHYRNSAGLLEKTALIFQLLVRLQTTLYIIAMLIMHGTSARQMFIKLLT